MVCSFLVYIYRQTAASRASMVALALGCLSLVTLYGLRTFVTFFLL